MRENIHGLEVFDPFRWLESDTEESRAWMQEQSGRTERALDALRDEATGERLRQLLSMGEIGGVSATEGPIFFLLREGDREQHALFALAAEGGEAEPVVDPQDFGEQAAIDWFYPSPSGRYLAFGVSSGGDERSRLLIRDAVSGGLLPDRIEHTKWCSLSWLHEETGFYYTRYPRPSEPDYDAGDPDKYHIGVFFHRLGDDAGSDLPVYRGPQKTDSPLPSVSDDDRWLVIANFRGWSASDVYLMERGKDPAGRATAPDPAHPLLSVVEGEGETSSGLVHRGTLYLFTNLGAPRGRIVAVEPERAGQRSAWREVVAEADGAIEEWVVAGDHIAIHYIEEIRSRIRLFDLEGTFCREVELPARGSLGALAADPGGKWLSFSFSSFFYPPVLCLHDLGRGVTRTLFQVAHDIEQEQYRLERVKVASRDGTPINVYFMYRGELKRDGGNPVLLYGYGGFRVSLLPGFTRSALYWLDSGGVYAVANLRGGGELGEAWHRAGMLENKARVFEDFEAVIRWLAGSGISRPDRIAITGGSNGGLLVGAMLTRVPESFRAAAGYVGLYDMLRFHLFPPAELWVSEFGDPRDPGAARYLHAYSPYHQVRDGVAYPAALIETALHDTRVFWGHSAKFAARLQQASASQRPIYFYLERDAGHGQGVGLRLLVDRYRRLYSFLERELGLR
jgi:prolyl oligopeptidase